MAKRKGGEKKGGKEHLVKLDPDDNYNAIKVEGQISEDLSICLQKRLLVLEHSTIRVVDL